MLFCKLWALSHVSLLISILSAQLVYSQYEGESDGGFYLQPQRSEGHRRHWHQDRPGPHHGLFYDGRQTDPQFRQGFGGNRMPGGGFRDPHDSGFRPGDGFRGHWHGAGYGNPPGFEYDDHSRAGYGNQPVVGYDDQTYYGYGGGNAHFRPRPNQPLQPFQPTFQPRPYPNGRNTPDIYFQTPGNPGNTVQPRPGSNGFQQPGFEQSGSVGFPFQSRPEQDSSATTYNQNSGQSGNPIQPRPQLDNQGSLSGNPENTLQPRPGHDSSGTNGFQQPGIEGSGNAGKTLQPRPGQTPLDAFQKPSGGQTGNPIQPRPTDSSKFFYQQPSGEGSSNPIQPLPGQVQNEIQLGQPTGSTIQPRPSPGNNLTDTTVEDNISAIFNTNEHEPLQISENGQESGDPKDQKVISETRVALSTNPLCVSGKQLSAGHCRKPA